MMNTATNATTAGHRAGQPARDRRDDVAGRRAGRAAARSE